jgi:hypothetical protein
MADAHPDDEGAQIVAAFKLWAHGDDETALRLAERAQRADGTAFPALLVLTAISSKGVDDSKTYEYAKKLVKAKRLDKTANTVMRSVERLRTIMVTREWDHVAYLKSTDENHEEWLSWSREFIAAYEARTSDA